MINKDAFVVLRLGRTVGYKTPHSDGSVCFRGRRPFEEWLNVMLAQYKFTTLAINRTPLCDPVTDEFQRNFVKRFCQRRDIALLEYDEDEVMQTLYGLGFTLYNNAPKMKEWFGIEPKTTFSVLPSKAYIHLLKVNDSPLPWVIKPRLKPEEVLQKYRKSTYGMVKELL